MNAIKNFVFGEDYDAKLHGEAPLEKHKTDQATPIWAPDESQHQDIPIRQVKLQEGVNPAAGNFNSEDPSANRPISVRVVLLSLVT